MNQNHYDYDEIMSDVSAELDLKNGEDRVMPQHPIKKRSGLRRFFSGLGKFLLVVLETVLLLVVILYGAMYVICKGPSPTARDLFVLTVRETSAAGFLADLFLTEDEIAQIEAKQEVDVYEDTDTSLIKPNKPADKTDADPNQGPVPDAWGLVDDDGDGIILEEIFGEGFRGYMMVVLDPSRVIMGSVPTSYGGRGYTVEEMVKHFDGVAGINAGGFDDPEGKGNGSMPNSMVVFEGKIHCEKWGIQNGFVGLDSNHILHVGKLTPEDIKERDIQYGVCFGPVLISNGESCDERTLISGINPRTAIGQRSDGAILLMVIDGRQTISLGATFKDMVDIFFEYGAVNACNLDGGSSSMMWYGDGYVNNTASVIGIRPVPTSFVVLKEGVKQGG